MRFPDRPKPVENEMSPALVKICLSSIEAEAAAVKKGGWDRQRPAGSSAGCHTPDKLPVERPARWHRFGTDGYTVESFLPVPLQMTMKDSCIIVKLR